MSTITVEDLLTQANKLPVSQRRKLKAKIEKGMAESLQDLDKPSVAVPLLFNSKDRTRESEWLKQNRAEYVGSWIALEGDQLITKGRTAKEVFAKARQQGIDRPLVFFVEEVDVYSQWV